MSAKEKYLDESGDTTLLTTITVNKYSIGSKDNTPDKYQMVWPKGVTILDSRIKKSITIRSKDRTLSDADINDAIDARTRENEAAERAAQTGIDSTGKQGDTQP